MKKIINHALARTIRASLCAQIQQLDNIEAELSHLDFLLNEDKTCASDAQQLAVAIQDARDALIAADHLLVGQVHDCEIYSRPPRLVEAAMRFINGRKWRV